MNHMYGLDSKDTSIIQEILSLEVTSQELGPNSLWVKLILYYTARFYLTIFLYKHVPFILKILA